MYSRDVSVTTEEISFFSFHINRMAKGNWKEQKK